MAGRIALVALLALTAFAPTAARAQESEKGDKTESSPGQGPGSVKKADGELVSVEAKYPPFSTRFAVLTAGLLITGSAWGFSYAASRGWPEEVCHITVAGSFNAAGQPCVSGPPGSAQLAIPVAGPWIALGKSGCASDEPNCPGYKIGLRAFAFTVDGIVQAAGAALFIQGLVMRTDGVQAGPKKTSPLALRYGGVELAPTPVVSRGMSGLGVSGTF